MDFMGVRQSLSPRPSCVDGSQLFLVFLVGSEVCPHEALPELAVIGDREMEQFVDDDIVAEGMGHGNEFVVEAEGSGG